MSSSIDAWRIFRILSEFVDGFERMANIGPSVTIFGSARLPSTHPYYKLAIEVGKKIAEKGFAVITGGGPGIMEAANQGAQQAKGRSCGININVPYEESSNPFIDRKYLMTFRYFFVRKVLFVRYALALVFLPGGYGTLDELFECLTLIQTKKVRPFPLILMGKAYWEGLIEWLRNTPLQEKCLSEADFELFHITDDPNEAAQIIEEHFKKRGEKPTFDLGIEE